MKTEIGCQRSEVGIRKSVAIGTIAAGLLAAGCINPVFNLNTPLVINRGVSVVSTGPARGTNAAVNVVLTVEGGGLAGASADVPLIAKAKAVEAP